MRATIRVRVLAEDGPQVWLAVSGRLARSTAPMLTGALRLREAEGFTVLFVDVGALAVDREPTLQEIRDLFPGGRRLAFHIIGSADDLRLQPGHDRRFVFHPGPASAWTVWVRGPSTMPSTRGRTAVRPSVRTRSHRSSLGSIT
ncbi:hypothetical protein ACFYW6_04065 [Streptomyces sp. NPDC002659]|uniref:hypothetical protein n=1 Tax=unclassified Streptomyces TaxID=2593676 RepID=UPI0033D97A6C